jgi:hypothetical protein
LASRRIPLDESLSARREFSKTDAKYIAMLGIDIGSLGNGSLGVSGTV